MKNILLISIFTLLSIASYSQAAESMDSIYQIESVERYKLFKTTNMWTFLKLDTRNGKIWQVQFSVKGNDYRFDTPLSTIPKVFRSEEFNNRFTLYPTDNMFNFLLLDQYDGRVWQVQWSQEPKERAIFEID